MERPLSPKVTFFPYPFPILLIFLAIAPAVLAIIIAQSAHAYEVTNVVEGGTVSGKVSFKGKAPEPKKLLITKDEEVCGKGSVIREEVKVSPNGGLQDVVVVLEGITKGKAWQAPPQGYVIDQKKCRFEPYLLAVPQGGELKILNSDSILHNIHSYELIGRARRSVFNVAQPKYKTQVTQTIRTKREKVIRLECDAHNWMLGWIYVVDNPYHAVVDKDGAFAMNDVPAGKYLLKVWHPFLGSQEKEINVTAKGTAEASFAYEQSIK